MAGPPRHVWGVLVVAVLAVSSSGVIVRSMGEIHPVAIAFWRTLGAAILLSPAIRRVDRGDVLRIWVSGAFLAAHFATWFASLDFTTVLRSTVLVATGPLWVGLYEWTVGRPPPRRFWMGLAPAVLGVALMTTETDDAASMYGDALALVGAWAAAAYLLIGRDVRKRVGIGTYASLVCAGATSCLLPTALLMSAPLSGFDGWTVGLLVLAIAGPQLLGHNGFNYALGYIEASTVSAMMLLEPVGAAILAVMVLGELPGGQAALGGLMTTAGVIYATTQRRRPDEQEA